jgi:hypothetical protein
MAAKLAIERGQIAKADLEGKGSYRAIALPRVCQHAVGLRKTLAEHELRQRRAIALEQPLDIARGEAVSRVAPIASAQRS